MKRPAAVSYVFGNPVSIIVLATATAYFTYQWWSNAGSGALALTLFLATSYAFGASDRLQKYNQWKREWDAMEGRAPSITFSRLYAHPVVRVLIGIALWCGGIYLIANAGNGPLGQFSAGLFGLATFAVIITGVVRLFRRSKPHKPIVRDMSVMICVSMPNQSPTLDQARASLPKYCLKVLDPV
jgi:hypothetical protein